ncbi:plakophilin-2 isoform X1 [Bufo bufo]|uniref:plakophilin-2 isoform X1 n=1 Tax=Bufo bufo TaxID=8384 RepID=UPI001ABE29D3|nr:plakophilin-2 isoform X1 [Bufo bufo]
MAVLASPNAEQGYIKTVLSKDNFMDLDSSSLALPSEEKLSISRQDLEKAMRIQHQVQLTMARKTTKKNVANGTIYQSVNIPDQVLHNTTLHRDTIRSPSKYDTMKNYTLPLQENNWGSSQTQYGQRMHENGWAKSYSSYSQWGNDLEGGQRKPIVRRDISPERQEALMSAYEKRKNTTAASLHYAGPRQSNMSTIQYSRSEFGHGTRPRQSTVKKSTLSDQDSVFISSVPNSPAGPYYQKRNSQSMDDLLEKRHYQTQAVGAGSQVRSQQISNRFDTHHTNTKYTTHRKEYIQSPSGASGIDMSGKRSAMTAAMAAMTTSGNVTQRDAVHLDTPVGAAQMTSEVQMTLERAVSLLQNSTTSAHWLTAAASYIQHECFQKAESRKKVYSLNAIPKLIQLLSNSDEDVQRAACAALRNLVYEDNDNKLEVYEQRAMPTLLNLLKNSQDLEIKKQITGLMWNLSSNDQLKVMLIRDALQTLTNNIIIPCSGWRDGEYSKNVLMSDPDILYNATGCLRNMSSAGPEGRKALRECDGLIDSLVHYISRSVADYKPDDKATENCVCVLHNLSYQLESEVPSRYSHNFNTQNRNLTRDGTDIGCFGSRSRKLKEDWTEVPIAEETSNPKGMECLWSSKLVRLYLSLIAKSSRNYTQEASLGSLQNLTAGNGLELLSPRGSQNHKISIPFSVAQTIVRKESGLQHIRNMLFVNEPGVKRTAVSLLRNLSRNSSLQNDIAKELMADLVRELPDRVPDSNIANETTASICYILNNLICNSSNNARMLLQNGGINKLIDISNSDSGMITKTGKASSLVLYNLWYHQDLHSAYKKAMYKKTDFVNPRTSKAHHSL